MPQDSVRFLMNPNVISVPANMPIKVAVDLILSNNFNGVPVVDKNGVLVGIITKYDLIIKRTQIRDDMVVSDVMNREPLVLEDIRSVDDAIKAFTDHHKVDPIPVIDSDKKLIGVISRYDMVRLFREYGVSDTKEENISSGPTYGFWAILALIAFGAGTVYYFFF